MGATSRPRCSGQHIRQRLVHPQTRVAGFCAVASAACPSRRVARDPLRRVASRRDARVWVNRERRRTRRTVSPPPRLRSFTRYTSLRWMSLRRSLPPAPFSHLPCRGPAGCLVRDRGRGGEKERGRRKAGRRGRASVSEASKEEQASEETRTGGGGGGGGRGGGGGKEDYYYYYSWGPPTTRPAAATPVRSQSALDRRPLDFAIHERR